MLSAKIFYLFFTLINLISGQFNTNSSPWLPNNNNNNRPNNNNNNNNNGIGGNKHTNYNYDDPIKQQNFELLSSSSTYDQQILPSKLPIQAPNGVIEIYNRVIDDLIKRLENDFKKRQLDPMDVIIRPTPPGPVRVPGHLQKRPFRRPGAALYKRDDIITILSNKRKSKDLIDNLQIDEKILFNNNKHKQISTFRGSGKISKIVEIENGDETTLSPTIATSIQNKSEISSEELDFLARSDEIFPAELDDDDDDRASRKEKKEETEEDEEDDDNQQQQDNKEKNKNVDTLIQKYQNKNTNPIINIKDKTKYNGGNKKKIIPINIEVVKTIIPIKKIINKNNNNNNNNNDEDDNDEDENDDGGIHNDDDDDDDDDNIEPGTLQSGGDRPNGGFYPQNGPPVIPAKPNGKLIGLSRIKRSSDVAVSVDARSAIITARLLVGPLDIIINDSVEPQERNIKATIPELEAELLLMERHGVVFLQRFTLDRAYGQDVEISIPKSKGKKGTPPIIPNHPDPNHPSNVQQRFQTKMAAHVSMEIVKLLRSGNLRVNLMRVAQSSMSKLKLPIQKVKKMKKKVKVGINKKEEGEEEKNDNNDKN